MEWVKVAHLFSVVGWMAGVFYMPRLLVNIAEAHRDGEPTQRLEGMAFRLFRFCTGLMVLGLGAGLALWIGQWWGDPWVHAKLAFVVVLVVYWSMNYVWLKQMMRGEFRRSSVFFRFYNEGSLVLFLPIIALAVFKRLSGWF